MKKTILFLTVLSGAMFATAQTATTDEGVVINGIKWATRNLAAQGAFVNNPEDYGGLFQWGRKGDGHEQRTSSVTINYSENDTPGHGSFIITTDFTNYDWMWSGRNDLWNLGSETVPEKAANDPCPAGWRVPTNTEFSSLRVVEVYETRNGINGVVFGRGDNSIFLPSTGYRDYDMGYLHHANYSGYYWSSTAMGYYTNSSLYFSTVESFYPDWRTYRSNGYCVRCVADEVATVIPVLLVTITGSVTATKEYDGTPNFRSEHIDISNANLIGTMEYDDDIVIIDKSRVAGTLPFSIADRSDVLTLSPLGLFSIAGAHAKYYRLSGQPSVTAVITPKPVTISLTVTKEYDGTPYFYNWHIDVDDFDNAIINGVLDKDFYGVEIDKRGITGMLPSAEVGTSGTLAISGSFALEGGSARNYYLLEQPTVTAKITKRGVTITGKITATKEYDGSFYFSSEHIDISNAKIIGTVDDDNDLIIDKSGVTGKYINGYLSLSGYFTLTGADTVKYYLSKQPAVLAEIVWKSYTVSFAGDEINISPQTIVSHGKLTQPTDPVRTHYDFGGWFTDNDTFKNKWDFETDAVTQDTTLYAKWNIKSYTVSFAGDEINIHPQKIVYQGKIDKPADPVRTHYNFGGWFTDDDTFKNEWNFETETVTQEITLYAKWTIMTGVVETPSAQGKQWRAASEVKIYPNPVKDGLFIIHNEQLIIKNVQICDLSGRVVFFSSFGEVGVGFDVSALSQGVYMIRIETDKGIVTEKFVKKW